MGDVYYEEKKITGLSESELTRFRRQQAGIIFQQYYLLPHMNVDKNVKMGADLSGNKDYREVIKAVGLEISWKSCRGIKRRRTAACLCLVVLPAGFFSVLAVLYGCRKLGSPVLTLLRGKQGGIFKIRRQKKNGGKNLSFVQDLRRSTAKIRLSLVFFIGFASFYFSSMMQMTFGMDELASAMFTPIPKPLP